MLQKEIKIGFISPFNPFDRKALSGTPYKIGEALTQMGAKLVWIPVKHNIIYKIYDKCCRIISYITKRRIMVDHTIIGATLESKSIDKARLNNCDLLFSPLSSSALYALTTDIPIIYLSDATFARMVNYYFFNLGKWSIKQGNLIEQKAQNMSSQIIVSSKWAFDSVLNDYHQPASKVHVIEFGANIDSKDIIKKEFKYNGHLDLLFLGVDWERKGGQIAVDACKYLNEQGMDATLHIVGIRNLDKKIQSLPYVVDHGFLNKNNPAQYNELVEIIKLCHCLLLPTIAECSAIAFCEASANGLPIFSHVTGGVANYVIDGKNGYLLPLGSTGKDFGDKIITCLKSGELEQISRTAVDVYNERLNWNVWRQKVETIITKMFDSQ